MIVANNNDKVTNKVGLSGKNSTTITKTSTKEITVALSSADGVGTGTRKALKIIKVDGANQSKLSGATFALYRKAGSSEVLFNTLTTDANGEAVFNNLWPGSYLLQEIAAPSGYILDSSKQPVTFDSTTAAEKELKVLNQKAATPTPTVKPTETPTPTEKPVETPTPTEKPTEAPTPTVTPTATPVETPTATPAASPVIDYSTPTPVTSSVPGIIVTPGPSATPTATPVATPSASPVQTPVVSSTPAAPQPTTATTVEDVPIDGEIPLGGIPGIVKEPSQVTIEVGVDEVPKGTVTDTPENGLPGKLPQTGENSPLPLYLTGGGLMILGAVMARRFKGHKKSR
ncbi:Cna protein B-type domain protein [compost metagenome]